MEYIFMHQNIPVAEQENMANQSSSWSLQRVVCWQLRRNP